MSIFKIRFAYFYCRLKVWIRQMGVDRLHWKEKQPFYNVLVEDGSCRYAATENLFPAKPQRIIGNPQVISIAIALS